MSVLKELIVNEKGETVAEMLGYSEQEAEDIDTRISEAVAEAIKSGETDFIVVTNKILNTFNPQNIKEVFVIGLTVGSMSER